MIAASQASVDADLDETEERKSRSCPTPTADDANSSSGHSLPAP
jgi:hypothetical protein